MKDKYFVSVNPQSGAGKAGKDWPSIQKKLNQASIDFEYAISSKHRESIEQVKEAINKGYRKFIGVGGDGTLHHIVNGIFMQNEVSYHHFEVALISIGTGNDWVRHYNTPTHYDEAIALIKKGNSKAQDIGVLNYENGKSTEYFMNFVGIGYDAYVVEHTADLKKYGQSAYLYGLVQCLFKFDAKDISIEVDGKEYVKDKVFMMIAGLGKYAGGGMMLSRDAEIDDGYFDLTVGKDLSKTDIIFMVHKLFNGKYVEHEKVSTLKCKHIKVQATEAAEVKAEADGELIGTGSFEISLLHKALRVIVS